MLQTRAREGDTKDFPRLHTHGESVIGLRIKVLKIDRGRVELGFHLLENGVPILTNDRASPHNKQ